jgi:CRP-like cAMP-binding protein
MSLSRERVGCGSGRDDWARDGRARADRSEGSAGYLLVLTLAEMVGTTRSRVSFFMNKFRKLGFIDYDGGGLEVHSSLLDVVLHD